MRQAWKKMRRPGGRSWSSSVPTTVLLAPAQGSRTASTTTTGNRQEAAAARQPARRPARHVVSVDVPALELSALLADADTIGVIYANDTDGLNFYNE